jgi:hypothetical protein
MKKLKSFIRWHTNQKPSEQTVTFKDSRLHLDAEANFTQERVQKVARAVRSQDVHTPSPQVIDRILSEVNSVSKYRWAETPWVWGIPVMLVIFSLLWLLLQPGNQLQWFTQGNQPATFKIYRAPAGTAAFKLIEEVPATPYQLTYQYADTLVLPGQTYEYLIEVRDQHGNTITSRTAISNTRLTSIIQIAILLTGFMLTFGIITIVQEHTPSPRLKFTGPKI